MATAADRAEQLKLQGNQCFQKGKFLAAIDMYTEAIVLAPGRSLYYSNRALCHSKLQRWESCRDDCQAALKFDALNAKASYVLGTSLMHLLAFDAAVEALNTALSSAQKTDKPRAFQQDIATELRRVKKRQWQRSASRVTTSMEVMHEPVTTPNGVSYERRCLEEHLRHNGAIDPLTRKKLTLDMLRPNTSLRAAIQDYLDKNSWAYEF
ncbi:hypothetical protein PF008_g7609 [Phytophthora fragariae]|uniref:RING-type E3 ubiquitin transferase n=1 Tax=Phytophthora fragariae TaxID=53985 RepID=A0A6G0S3Q8_9STRA|nr:hypothetical protein PF008_g7609 [Phytophthora fragariae]